VRTERNAAPDCAVGAEHARPAVATGARAEVPKMAELGHLLGLLHDG